MLADINNHQLDTWQITQHCGDKCSEGLSLLLIHSLCPTQTSESCSVTVPCCFLMCEARNLGVLFDSELSFDAQVTKLVQSFVQLRYLTKIRSLIFLCRFRKGHCNALYSGTSKQNIQSLQLIRNAAARLLTHTKRSDHITPVLAALHWQPVSFTINFKILLLVFKALNGQAPAYICDLLTPCEPDRCLRSSGRALLMVPKSRLCCQDPSAMELPAWISQADKLF